MLTDKMCYIFIMILYIVQITSTDTCFVLTGLISVAQKKFTDVKWNYQIMIIGVMASCQKFYIILENKVI